MCYTPLEKRYGKRAKPILLWLAQGTRYWRKRGNGNDDFKRLSFPHIGVVAISQRLQLAFQSVGIESFVVDISCVFPLVMIRAIDILAGNAFVNPVKSEFVQYIGQISGQGTDIGIMERPVYC